MIIYHSLRYSVSSVYTFAFHAYNKITCQAVYELSISLTVHELWSSLAPLLGTRDSTRQSVLTRVSHQPDGSPLCDRFLRQNVLCQPSIYTSCNLSVCHALCHAWQACWMMIHIYSVARFKKCTFSKLTQSLFCLHYCITL